MVKKTKLWRKTLPDQESTKVDASALKAKSQSVNLFSEDRTGQVAAKDIYPERFAKEKFLPSVSKSEHFLLKKLPIKRPRADQSEVFDLWAEEGEASSQKAYENRHIPPVINPHPGQSYKPDQVYHEDIIEKVIEEELIKEDDERRHQETINSYNVVEFDESPKESEDEQDIAFLNNPAVKVKYLTATQKNIKERNKLKEKKKKILADERKSQKQFDQIPVIMRQMNNLEKKYKNLKEEEKIRKKMKIELEATGEIAPKIRMGKFRYKKPETVACVGSVDNLRKISVKGNSVEERMDSFVRRKMVDLSKAKDPKKITLKEYSGNDREIEFKEKKEREKAQKIKEKEQREAGMILLNK